MRRRPWVLVNAGLFLVVVFVAWQNGVPWQKLRAADDGVRDGQLVAVGAPVPLTGGGTGAVATDGRIVYYADVGVGKTEVTAVPVAGGGGGWRASVSVEPVRLTLTVVGTVLVLDAQQSATDRGQDVRAVVDRADGRMLWKRVFDNLVDVAFVGTDAVVEHYGTRPVTERIDLLTGTARWSRPGAGTSAAPRARAPLTWPASPPTASPARSDVYGGPFRESLAVDPARVVALDERGGKASVLDAATGRTLVTKDAPLDPKAWTVFDGFVVGQVPATSPASRPKIVAYRLDTLERAWEVPQEAGTVVLRVKPCGPHLVCVRTSGDPVTAFDLNAGAKAWRQDVSRVAEWYIVGGRLLTGESGFESPVVRDPATGKTIQTLKRPTRIAVSRISMIAAADGHGVMETGTVATVDLASGVRHYTQISEKIIQVSLVGDVLAVVTDKRVLVFRIPGATAVTR